MRLAINFPDNDFVNTFVLLMRLIKEAYVQDETFNFTKAQIVEIVNGLLPGIYRLFQNRFIRRSNFSPHAYLRIEEKDVYLEEEIDDYMKSECVDNGTFYVLDTDLIGYSNNAYIYCF